MNIDDNNQELCTLENIRDYVQKKINVVNEFDKYKKGISTLEKIKDYIEMNINDILVNNI